MRSTIVPTFFTATMTLAALLPPGTAFAVSQALRIAPAGESAGDWFGRSVAGAGDVNGDGHDDVIVGAPFGDAGSPASRCAYIYFGGPTMDLVPDVVLTSSGPGTISGCRWPAPAT
jgi:hypothetical protein